MNFIEDHRRRRRRGRALLASFVGVGMAMSLNACGGGGSGESAGSTTATSTHAAFIARGDVILCAKSDRVAAVVSRLPAQPTDAELRALVLDGVLPAVKRAHDDLEALPVPGGDEAEVAAILGSMQRAIDLVADDPATMLGDVDPFVEADRLITGFGLIGCPS
jgi:hypothetical protein